MTSLALRPSRPPRPASPGFTLIETMITVAIVAILARIALPSYLDYVKRGKLTEGFNQLSMSAVALGQWYQDNRSYANFACPGAAASGNFTYTCTLGASSYTLTATGANALSGFAFTLTDAGNRATTAVPSGWTTNASCWVSSRSGTCM